MMFKVVNHPLNEVEVTLTYETKAKIKAIALRSAAVATLIAGAVYYAKNHETTDEE